MLFKQFDIKLDELNFALFDYEDYRHSYEDSLEYLTPKKKEELEKELNNKVQKIFNLFKEIQNIYDPI